jgi:hypothetical protein
MTMPLAKAPGNYRFLRGTGELPFCNAVIAEAGYEIVRAQLERPVPWREGFRTIEAHLAGLGRPRQALCSVELRCTRAYTRDGFAEFNVGYANLMRDWGLFVDGFGCTTRTNVAPEHSPPSEQVLFAFAYTVPTAGVRPSFVLAGAPEGPSVRPGETSAGALAEKVEDAVRVLSGHLEALDQRWDAVNQVAVYTAHDALPAMRDGLLPKLGPAALNGLRWFISRPPIVGLEIEIDARRVGTELRIGG